MACPSCLGVATGQINQELCVNGLFFLPVCCHWSVQSGAASAYGLSFLLCVSTGQINQLLCVCVACHSCLCIATGHINPELPLCMACPSCLGVPASQINQELCV